MSNISINGFKYDDLDSNGFRGTTLIQGENPDIVLILDRSGSSTNEFFGSVSVGNQNSTKDFLSNSILDAEIAAAKSFLSSLIDQGFGASRLALVSFADDASIDFNGQADDITFNSYSFNIAAENLEADGGTNFNDPLAKAETILKDWGSDQGNVIFLSDGEPNSGSLDGTSEFRSLDDLGYNVQAFGVGDGAARRKLNAIDSDGDAYIFRTPEEVQDVLSGKLGGSLGATQYTEPGLKDVEIFLDLNANGSLDPDEPSAITDADGNYEIDAQGVPFGTYAIKEKIPQGYLQTETPASIVVSADSQDFKDVNFGNAIDPNPPVDPPEEETHLSILSCFVLDDLLTIQFDNVIDNLRPSANRFRITVNDDPFRVLSTSISELNGEAYLVLEDPVLYGQNVRLSYSDLIGDQDFGVIQSSGGVDLGTIKDIEVENISRDDVAPQLINAEVDGSVLTLDFNEAINQAPQGLPVPSSFTVEVNGRRENILEVNPGAQGSVVLNLEEDVVFGDEVSISYFDLNGNQDSGVIQDPAGNDLPTINDFDVRNNSFEDPAALGIASATVDGKTLALIFDRNISDTEPSSRSFRVEADGDLINVRTVDVFPNDRQVVLELSEAVTDRQDVTISYTDPSGNQRSNVVEDEQGNDLMSFTNKAVINDTRDTNPLTLDQGEVIDPSQILLNFSKELNTTEPAKSRFKVFVDGKRSRVSSIEMSPDEGQAILNLKNDVPLGAEVNLSYKDLASDQTRKVIEDTNGNDLASFKNFVIENFVQDEDAPILQEAVANFDMISLEFDELIATGNVKNNRFKVNVNGKRNRVTGIEIPEENNLVDLFLRKPVNADDIIEISYRDPKRDQKKNVVQDEAGNDLESFRDFEAGNITSGKIFALRTSGSDDLVNAMTSADLSA